MSAPSPPARLPGRTWAPALLLGHAVLAGLLVLVAVGAVSAGDGDTTRAVVLGLALVVVVVTAVRVGRRRPSRDGRFWAVAALWLVVPWTWAGLVVGGSSPALLAPGVPLLAFFWWPFLTGALLVGMAVAGVLVLLDR